jgi:hypothetical protein
VILSFAYRVACGVFQLLALRLRSSQRKEIEILVLRHELDPARCAPRGTVELDRVDNPIGKLGH